MKALVFETIGLDNLQFKDIADPGMPEVDEVRVRIAASSLNGHDYNAVVGNLPVAKGRLMLTDGAGVVEAVGANVTGLKPGDSVVSTFFPDWLNADAPTANFSRTPGDGIDGFGTSVVVRHESFFTLAPKGWTHLEAATLPTAGLTAWRAVVGEGKVKAGDNVLLLGTGGVSIFALQMAKALGARVIVTSSSDEKLARASALGADFVVNYRTHPEWEKQVLQLTGGRGVDLVVETGGPLTLPQSIAASRIGGHIVLVGVLTGLKGVIPTVAIMARQLRLTGIMVGSRTHQQEMVQWLEKTNLRPIIDCVFSLEKTPDALRYQENGNHFGKIGIDYSSVDA